MKTSVRHLRQSMKTILSAVQHGKEVVIYSRNHAIAKIVPIKKTKTKEDEDEAFGMWHDYSLTTNVNKYLRNLRKGRKHDI